MDESTVAWSHGEKWYYRLLNFRILLLAWDSVLGGVGRREQDAHVWIIGTEAGRAAAQGRNCFNLQKSPKAKYWLLLEDGYFYLMVWQSWRSVFWSHHIMRTILFLDDCWLKPVTVSLHQLLPFWANYPLFNERSTFLWEFIGIRIKDMTWLWIWQTSSGWWCLFPALSDV